MLRSLALLLLVACGDGFSAIQQADTPDADPDVIIPQYEQYLKDYPDGRWVLQANDRLETLYLAKAAKRPDLRKVAEQTINSMLSTMSSSASARPTAVGRSGPDFEVARSIRSWSRSGIGGPGGPSG